MPTVMLSGRVLVDLRDVEPDKARLRLLGLARLPHAVRVDVVVGSLAANPSAARELAQVVDRLDITIVGEPHAVKCWVSTIRDPDVLFGDTA